MVSPPEESPRHHLAELRVDLGARAAGFWWHAGDWLEQVAFTASPALDPEVGRAFAEGTRSVPLARLDLGIVRAAVSGEPAVSRAAELPDDEGSGHWLRAFGADRSVAVPIQDATGAVRAVVAVALAADNPLSDPDAAERIRAAALPWTTRRSP
jgi:hypothetical protein